MLHELRASELGQWMGYLADDPVEERADVRAGIITAGVHNAFGAKKDSGERFAPTDFMPFAHQDKQEQRRALAAKARNLLNNAALAKKRKK